MLMFTPVEMIQFDYNNIFSSGLVQPPPRSTVSPEIQRLPALVAWRIIPVLKGTTLEQNPQLGDLYTHHGYTNQPGTRLARGQVGLRLVQVGLRLRCGHVGGWHRPGAPRSNNRGGTPHLGRTFFLEADGSVFFLGGGIFE